MPSCTWRLPPPFNPQVPSSPEITTTTACEGSEEGQKKQARTPGTYLGYGGRYPSTRAADKESRPVAEVRYSLHHATRNDHGSRPPGFAARHPGNRSSTLVVASLSGLSLSSRARSKYFFVYIYKRDMARALVCLRYFLVGGVIVLGISGAVQSFFAGYFIYQLYEYAPLTPDEVCGSSAALLGMGVVTCLISWCSWHFLNFTNKGQVVIFAACLAIISAVQTGAGVWALVRHEQVDALPVAHLEKVFAFAVTDDKHVWDHMQSRLHCCGVSGPTSYRKEDAIPWSCCDTSSLANSNDTKGVCTSIYARGCHHVVINRTRSILLHVFLLALCSVLLQVCFILCATCYTKACKERQKKRRILMLASQPTTPQPKDLEGHPLAPPLSRYSKPPNEAQM